MEVIDGLEFADLLTEAEKAKKYHPDKALDIITEAEKLDPMNQDLLTMKADCLLRIKNPYTARSVAAKIIELHGDHNASYYLLARSLKDIGKPEEAEEMIRKAYSLERNKKTVVAFFGILLHTGKYSEARQLMRKERLVVGRMRSFYYISMAYFRDGRLVEAESYLRRCLRQSGCETRRREYYLLNKIFLARGKTREAEILDIKRKDENRNDQSVIEEIINLSRDSSIPRRTENVESPQETV